MFFSSLSNSFHVFQVLGSQEVFLGIDLACTLFKFQTLSLKKQQVNTSLLSSCLSNLLAKSVTNIEDVSCIFLSYCNSSFPQTNSFLTTVLGPDSFLYTTDVRHALLLLADNLNLCLLISKTVFSLDLSLF